jgi:hypothetical protein
MKGEQLTEEEERYRWVDSYRKREREEPLMPTEQGDQKRLEIMRSMMESTEILICFSCKGAIAFSCCELHRKFAESSTICTFCLIEYSCQRCGTMATAKAPILDGFCRQCRGDRMQIKNILKEAEGHSFVEDALYA